MNHARMRRAVSVVMTVVLAVFLLWAWSPPATGATGAAGATGTTGAAGAGTAGTAGATSSTSPPLSDIKGHWAEKYITDLVSFGIIGGYPDNTFRPNNPITRAEFVKLAVLAELTNPSDPNSRVSTAGLPAGTPLPFSDTAGHWSQTQGFLQQAVQWRLVVPDEYPGGRFEPDRQITRVEMAQILVRAIGKNAEARQAGETGTAALSFTDRDDVPPPLRGYVQVAADKGMIGGYPDGTFRPAAGATRAEAAKMISRRFEASYTWACYTHHSTVLGTAKDGGAAPPVAGRTGSNGSLSVTVLSVRSSAGAEPGRVSGATVTLEPGGYTATTTARGEAVFTSLPPAGYRLRVEASGFEPYAEPKKVQVLPKTASETQVALFPAPSGEPVASLEAIGPDGRPVSEAHVGAAVVQVPYNTAFTVSAAGSRNASRSGFSWYIHDASGHTVADQNSTQAGAALTPQAASTETDDPVTFSLTLPAAGQYTVRLDLTNPAFPGVVNSSTLKVQALNTRPEAVASVMAGPAPIKKTPATALATSIRLRVVKVGETVWLRGWGIDPNAPSPEQYNAGGNAPDVYGKNYDHYQRQFGWQWSLTHASQDGWQDATALLSDRSAQYPRFTADQAGTYRATLVVSDNDAGGSLASEPATVDILALGGEAGAAVSDTVCQTCHADKASGWATTAHGKAIAGAGHSTEVASAAAATAPATAAGCQTCHGPGSAHVTAASAAATRTGGSSSAASIAESASTSDLTLIKSTISVTYGAGLCGTCHQEYGQWQKSHHSDGDSYGYGEVASALLLNCTGCHYAKGHNQRTELAASRGKAFFEVNFSPLDRDKLPAKDEPGITCVACHDPHPATAAAEPASAAAAVETAPAGTTVAAAETAPAAPATNPASLVHGSSGKTCDTCHYEKWQNAVLEGMAGQIENGYEYPGRDYFFANPHKTPDKCVLCHMSVGSGGTVSGTPSNTDVDVNGILLVGGHTLRMRDAGPDGQVGGFGPRADDRTRERDPDDADDLLNVAPCQTCHAGLSTFDRNGVQKRVYDKWVLLGNLLKERNGGVLPGIKPGDKCATCHRGGTLPFDDDPELVLENAYTNYKLVMNDRSWGIHNPKYVEALLDDSIASVREKYAATPR